MAIKEVKAGEKYTLELLGVGMTQNKFTDEEWGTLELPSGRLVSIRPFDFEALSHANGIKNAETAPKYDPCRLFRKGDKVKPRERNGRIPWAKDMTLTVVADESKAGVAVRDEETGEERLMCVLFLELVTPVEELEPYSVSEGAGIIEVYNEKREAVKAWFYSDVKAGVKALAEAEAERDRLNAEWRKEQSNG